MEQKDIEELVEKLSTKKASDGYEALNELLALSQESDAVYPYMEKFISMLNGASSYERTRGLALIAANARWDTECLIDEHLDAILSHLQDSKPITVRQFVKDLPKLAAAKPELAGEILMALNRADTMRYPLSMRPLVEEDIRKASLAISKIVEEQA